MHKLNELHSQNLQKDAQLEARLQAYEMAFKMQTEATDNLITVALDCRAPRHKVYETWTQPEWLKKWFRADEGYTCKVAETITWCRNGFKRSVTRA